MKTLTAFAARVALAFVLTLSLFHTTPTLAQDQEPTLTPPTPALVSPTGTTFGLRAGFNASDFYGESLGATDSRMGLHGGLFLNYRPSPRWAVQPEVVLHKLEGRVDHSRVFENSGWTTYELGMLEMPLLAKFYFPQRSGVTPNLFAGPALGVRLFADARDTRKALDEVDLDEHFRRTSYGLHAGLGFDAFTGRHNLAFDLRYQIGLSNLLRDDQPDFHNRGFSFSVGLGF